MPSAEVKARDFSPNGGQFTSVVSAAEEAAINVQSVAVAAEELGSSVKESGRQVHGSANLAEVAVH